MKMRIVRTIHPVGLGAFYSEKFIFENEVQKTVVYDCGTKRRDYQCLVAELSSYFYGDKVIDLFIVSHFDEDHINGITHLKKMGVKIKTVVVPLIDRKDKWFYICTGGESVMGAISDPKSFFGADRVMQVASADADQLSESQLNDSEEIMVDGGGDRIIRSGSRMVLTGLLRYWVYVPYNFDEEQRRKELVTRLKNDSRFVTKAKEMKCRVEDLLHNDQFIESSYDYINRVYKGICKDGANRCSLVVYSGPYRNNGVRVESWSEVFPIRCGYRCRCRWMYREKECGCLYLGDTDLNQGRSQNKIIKQLELFLKHCISEIGTIQLPHHGSIKNFNKSLLSYNTNYKLFFASFGNGNTYGHPSYDVVEQIISSDNIFCGVNEDRGSGLVESIILI